MEYKSFPCIFLFSWAFEACDSENIWNYFSSISSFIYYKTQAEMCYKWIQLETLDQNTMKCNTIEHFTFRQTNTLFKIKVTRNGTQCHYHFKIGITQLQHSYKYLITYLWWINGTLIIYVLNNKTISKGGNIQHVEQSSFTHTNFISFLQQLDIIL